MSANRFAASAQYSRAGSRWLWLAATVLLFLAALGAASPALATDYGVDFDAYCKSHNAHGAVNPSGTNQGWSCSPDIGRIWVPAVCEWEYGKGMQAITISPAPGHAGDWRCRGELKPVTCACKRKASQSACLIKSQPYVDTYTWVESPKNSEANPSSPEVLQNYCYRHRDHDSGACCNDIKTFSGSR